jgi:hypothetical protein
VAKKTPSDVLDGVFVLANIDFIGAAQPALSKRSTADGTPRYLLSLRILMP